MSARFPGDLVIVPANCLVSKLDTNEQWWSEQHVQGIIIQQSYRWSELELDDVTPCYVVLTSQGLWLVSGKGLQDFDWAGDPSRLFPMLRE